MGLAMVAAGLVLQQPFSAQHICTVAARAPIASPQMFFGGGGSAPKKAAKKVVKKVAAKKAATGPRFSLLGLLNGPQQEKFQKGRGFESLKSRDDYNPATWDPTKRVLTYDERKTTKVQKKKALPVTFPKRAMPKGK